MSIFAEEHLHLSTGIHQRSYFNYFKNNITLKYFNLKNINIKYAVYLAINNKIIFCIANTGRFNKLSFKN